MRAILAAFFLVWSLACSSKPEQGIAAPPDVAGPPADAERTTGGLASKVLAEAAKKGPLPD